METSRKRTSFGRERKIRINFWMKLQNDALLRAKKQILHEVICIFIKPLFEAEVPDYLTAASSLETANKSLAWVLAMFWMSSGE